MKLELVLQVLFLGRKEEGKSHWFVGLLCRDVAYCCLPCTRELCKQWWQVQFVPVLAGDSVISFVRALSSAAVDIRSSRISQLPPGRPCKGTKLPRCARGRHSAWAGEQQSFLF